VEQRAHGFKVWLEPQTPLRAPLIFNIRSDPFERADYEAADYGRWFVERVFLLVPALAFVGGWLSSFKEFPPRQKPAVFNMSQVMEQLLSMGKAN
jgi:arylsulfatase